MLRSDVMYVRRAHPTPSEAVNFITSRSRYYEDIYRCLNDARTVCDRSTCCATSMGSRFGISWDKKVGPSQTEIVEHMGIARCNVSLLDWTCRIKQKPDSNAVVRACQAAEPSACVASERSDAHSPAS